jgi:hypothetical protein
MHTRCGSSWSAHRVCIKAFGRGQAIAPSNQ